MHRPYIDYESYAKFMRGALSGPDICNKDHTINHNYFNTKKGFYWSDHHNELLINGLKTHGMNFYAICKEFFGNGKTIIELYLRTCLLFNVKDIKHVTEESIKDLKKDKSLKKIPKSPK